MPETIKQELVRRLGLKDVSGSDLDAEVPILIRTLDPPELEHLVTRMVLTILRQEQQ